ncbi:MAG: hypothetical protein IH830_09250 [Planctomycetes bacterium]|nr:hypothetical protein [Planctomycetota bacterium]
MNAAQATAHRLLITAGATHEPIDEVRFIGNRSSGRMGIALAEAAITRNMTVTLLLGPTLLTAPCGSQMTTWRFQTTDDLKRLLEAHWPQHDVLFMAAAVADFRPVQPQLPGKLPHRSRPWTLQLEPTPDLLGELASITRPDQIAIGFALEPADRLCDAARQKLAAKKLAAIVANPLETMDSDRISATVLLRNGRAISPDSELSKRQFADWLLDRLDEIIAAARTTPA